MWRISLETLASWQILTVAGATLALAAVLGILTVSLIRRSRRRRDARESARAIREERIKRRAYEFWEEEGRPDGRAQEHWSRAAREMGLPAMQPAPNEQTSASSRTGLGAFARENFLGLVITLIVIALLALLGYGIIHPLFLASLRDIETARGLITFLFAVGTIGIFVVVTSATFVGELAEADVRFTRGKDTLSMLIGIFGTILGFYFGSTTSEDAPDEVTDEPEVVLESFLIEPEHPVAGTRAKMVWLVNGGTAPYHYFVDFDAPPGVIMKDSEVLLVNDTGFMYHEFDLPDHSDAFSLKYQIVAIDAEARSDRVVKGTIAVASPGEVSTPAAVTGTSPRQVSARQ